MHWLSFFIGALFGWLLGWLIDILFCRQRRAAAEAQLRAELERSNEELIALRKQVGGYQDLQVRLDAANAAVGTLKSQLATTEDLQVRLNGANAEIDSLKAQLDGMKGLQADLVSWKAQATEKGLEVERLNAELAARASAGTAAAAAGISAAAQAALPTGGVEVKATGPAGVTPETGITLAAPAVEAGYVEPTLSAPEAGVTAGAPAVEPGEPDDLTVIEGIGPKINALLNQHGIYTFGQLAAAAADRLRAILATGGPRFRLANPETWPEQAAYARDGKWEALQAFQDTLKAGRVV